MQNAIERTNRNHGFTLIELMITVAIAAIVLSITVPSLTALVDSHRVKASRDQLVSALQRGQQEALANTRSTYLCPTRNGNSCAASWSADNGWLLYVDDDRSNSFSAANDQLITVQQRIAAEKIKSAAVSQRFFPSGRSVAASFAICSANSDVDEYLVSIDLNGRVTYAKASSSDCA